jgi:predicted NBD/HSP70 family sugar kinase
MASMDMNSNFGGNILGEALADAIAFSSPEAIVLFGGLAKSGDYIMKPIQKSIDDNILNIYKGKKLKTTTIIIQYEKKLKYANQV